MTLSSIRQTWYFHLISICLMVVFVMTTMVVIPRVSYAQEGIMGLPQPGTMVNLSPAFEPLMITGLRVHPENPLLMDFIVSTGNNHLNNSQVKKESDRLIKYFLACLTIPDNDQWVNLSPYEKQRIIPEDLGQTVLGQDMLEQDYLLKQLTASLIYPEKNLGKNFWDKVYAKASQMYGTTQIPMNTFNKVWILPDSAKIYEHNDTVLVVKSHLKVMLDEDYLALTKHAGIDSSQVNNLASQVVRQIILPAIEHEVNTGKNFAQLRQIYNSMILAVWFKKNLKQAFLNQVYSGKAKVNGVNVDDPAIKEKIYKQYLEAYKKGVFNYIKEENDLGTNQVTPRKYFSGGLVEPSVGNMTMVGLQEAQVDLGGKQLLLIQGLTQRATRKPAINPSAAMTAPLKWTDVQGNIDRWLPLAQRVTLNDINLDMFRDYDYRYVKDGVPLKPEVVFIQTLVLAKMALKKSEAAGIKTRDVLVARDARKIEPEIVDAEIAGLRYAGLNVVFVGEEPNCVTSYSWAVQSREWLMTIFNTASHVSQPDGIISVEEFSKSFGSDSTLIINTLLENHLFERISPDKIHIMQSIQETQAKLSELFTEQRVNDILKVLTPDIYVRGLKVAQLGVVGGNLLSLNTKEIKNESLSLVRAMVEHKTDMMNMKAAVPGELSRKSIEADAIRFNTAVGLVAANNESLFQLGQDIKQKNANTQIQSIIDRLGTNKPLTGLKIVVEGSHTPSGPLTSGVFKNLGASVVGLNLDVHEISGVHNADPSIDRNLATLKGKIIETHANFGIAFDLDGDRGAILIPEWNPDGTIKTTEKGEQVFHMLAPDNLLGMLMPSLLNNWGYAASGKKIGVIRDVLGTYGVNNSAKENGVEMFQTDAGYVYLKALKERMEAQGYVFPVYGERSGHTWLHVSGEIENPVAVAVLFSTIVARLKDNSDINGVLNVYRKLTIPYSQSPRFQPFYHPQLLQWLSEHNKVGWKYAPGMIPPQAIVALGKDETVKRLKGKFETGSIFGEYKVTAFNTYQDPVDEGGLYRFADIMFEKNGQFAGRVVVRASSNDPTFVMSYEAPVLSGDVQEADKNRVMTAGIVMKFMADEGIAIFTREQMHEFMSYLPPDKQEVQFNKANLGPVEADLNSYVHAAINANDLTPPDVLSKDDQDTLDLENNPPPSAAMLGDKKSDQNYVVISDEGRGSTHRKIKYSDGLVIDDMYLTIPGPNTKIKFSGIKSGVKNISGDLMSASAMDIRNKIDHAMVINALAETPEGGINLSSKNWKLQSEGQKINITFDSAMVAQFRRGDFSGVSIKILDVVPINLIPLLGLKEEERQVAKV